MDRLRVRRRLLAWYDREARELPWRQTRDPYAIWVSEVMLQQTRVQTVVAYYERFMQRFPTPEALAAAPDDAVMAAWSGLGYYRRAKCLHQGVREVVARYTGRVPSEAEALRALPGIGRYTAGAILSIGFGRAEPVVDGNVARVLCRLFAIKQAPSDKETTQRLWREAGALVKGSRPGDLNQAWMELGATCCTKHKPRCEVCPLQKECAAYARGLTEELPAAAARNAAQDLALVSLVATEGRGKAQRLWLSRGEGSLFSGLWNLPMRKGRGVSAARALLKQSGLHGRLVVEPIGMLHHVLTHRRLKVQLWRVHGALLDPQRELRSVALLDLHSLGVSRLTYKAIERAGLKSKAPSLEAPGETY